MGLLTLFDRSMRSIAQAHFQSSVQISLAGNLELVADEGSCWSLPDYLVYGREVRKGEWTPSLQDDIERTLQGTLRPEFGDKVGFRCCSAYFEVSSGYSEV